MEGAIPRRGNWLNLSPEIRKVLAELAMQGKLPPHIAQNHLADLLEAVGDVSELDRNN